MNDETEMETEGAVALFGDTVLSDPSALAAAMEDTVSDGARGGDVSFLSFSGKSGEYKCGTDERSPPPDEPFLLAATRFELGWMCWKGGKPVGKRLALITDPRIPEPDPEEFGPFGPKEGWSKARSITMKSLPHKEQVYFSTSSRSGVAEFADLQKQVLARIKSGQPYFAIVTLDKAKFGQHNNWKPVFTIQKWVDAETVSKMSDPDFDPMSLMEDDGDGPAPAPAPKKRL